MGEDIVPFGSLRASDIFMDCYCQDKDRENLIGILLVSSNNWELSIPFIYLTGDVGRIYRWGKDNLVKRLNHDGYNIPPTQLWLFDIATYYYTNLKYETESTRYISKNTEKLLPLPPTQLQLFNPTEVRLFDYVMC